MSFSLSAPLCVLCALRELVSFVLQMRSGMEGFSGRQIGRRRVTTFRAQKSSTSSQRLWPRPLLRAYMPDCILAPPFAARSRIPDKNGFRLEFPIVWQPSLKSIAMTSAILGVDIAKDKFDCVLLIEGKQHRQTFTNTAAGWKKLSHWLEKNGAKTVHACMEATGRLWHGLAQHLIGAQHRVSVVNPLRIKRYAHSR